MITIIIPVHNGETTLPLLLASLLRQNNKELAEEIIFILDGANPASTALVENFLQNDNYKSRIIVHQAPAGLASCYNEGIAAASTAFFLFMHQDIVLNSNDVFSSLLAPFDGNPDVVVTYPRYLLPVATWEAFSFWQKCFFSRQAGRVIPSYSGKCDCYRKELLLSKVGGFDEETYRTAGEDGDIARRIAATGLKTVNVPLELTHLHSRNPDFSFKDLFYKECQYGEAHGANLRKHGAGAITGFLMTYFRPLLVLGLFLPVVRMPSAVLVAFYSVAYTWRVYLYGIRTMNWRTFLLPAANVFLLFAGAACTALGFMTKRQRL